MIIVNVVVETSEKNISAFKETIATMEAASREESGCHDYTFSVELNNPNTLRITERWENAEALQLHMGTEHMAAFNAAMANHKATSMNMSCYEANEIPFPSR